MAAEDGRIRPKSQNPLVFRDLLAGEVKVRFRRLVQNVLQYEAGPTDGDEKVMLEKFKDKFANYN